MVTVLDSFEDGDMSEYSGDTADFSIDSTDSIDTDGKYRLENNTNKVAISRTDIGIQTGQTPFGAYLWPTSTYYIGAFYADIPGFLFAVQSETNHSNMSCYGVSLDVVDNRVNIDRFDSGNRTILANSSATIERATTYKVVGTTWDDSGNITFEVRDKSDNVLGTVSTVDTTYTSGGIGWANISSVSNNIYFDYAFKTVSSGSPPSAPSGLTATLQ